MLNNNNQQADPQTFEIQLKHLLYTIVALVVTFVTSQLLQSKA